MTGWCSYFAEVRVGLQWGLPGWKTRSSAMAGPFRSQRKEIACAVCGRMASYFKLSLIHI
eukprot:10586981-Prorocentrum_lima.AAC.1